MMRVAIIGAGAAGCFCAIEAARRHPDWQITVFEAGRNPLAKVAVTGGGRCNLTNSFEGVSDLRQVYPRGHRLMGRLFHEFDHQDTWNWFVSEGVPLVLQEDQCIFPASQDAMQIVSTLLERMHEASVKLCCNRRLSTLRRDGPYWEMLFSDGSSACSEAVVITTGGSPHPGGLAFLDALGLDRVDPVPSLFTLRIDSPLRQLTGTVVRHAGVALAGTKFKADGPLLLTDWGMSGPAILKLSSYAARFLAQQHYAATLLVNWLGGDSAEEAAALIRGLAGAHPQKQIATLTPERLTGRLWDVLTRRSGLREDQRWAELGSKGMNRLCQTLTADPYPVNGRAAFKEEFVTCGGVSLSEINPNTLEAKRFPGLFFAGEVLDIDAVTGGFNLQAAWTTGYTVAAHLEDSPNMITFAT